MAEEQLQNNIMTLAQIVIILSIHYFCFAVFRSQSVFKLLIVMNWLTRGMLIQSAMAGSRDDYRLTFTAITRHRLAGTCSRAESQLPLAAGVVLVVGGW